MGQNFHKIEAVRLEGGDPPKAVNLIAFPSFFTPSLLFFHDIFDTVLSPKQGVTLTDIRI